MYFTSQVDEFKICKHCSQKISSKRMTTHQIKCSIKNRLKTFREGKKSKQAVIKQKQSIEFQLLQVEEQKFPCSLCGYRQSIQQLDKHWQTCSIKSTACPFCSQLYPLDIIEDHLDFCQNQAINKNDNQRQESSKCEDFKIFTHLKSQKEADKCKICFICFKYNQNYVWFSCGHMFHGHCINIWLQQNESCFICKSNNINQAKQSSQLG